MSRLPRKLQLARDARRSLEAIERSDALSREFMARYPRVRAWLAEGVRRDSIRKVERRRRSKPAALRLGGINTSLTIRGEPWFDRTGLAYTSAGGAP